MSIEDAIFNQLVQLDILDYEEAQHPHECRCCGLTTVPTYKLRFEEEGDNDLSTEAPYLFICEECYNESKEVAQ